MQSPGSSQSSPELNPRERHAVVLDISRAHDKGCTALVFCLEFVWDFQNSGSACLVGHPFRLYDTDGKYIWLNQKLRNIGIAVGSIISCLKLYKGTEKWFYSGNTGKKMETDKVLSQLWFPNENNKSCAVAYRGIEEAFPDAVISQRQGVYQEITRPYPHLALIGICSACLVDDRIEAVTQLNEKINLSNRSISHTQTSIEPQIVQNLSSNGVVGVILVGFGLNPAAYGKYQALCEGILLNSGQGTQAHTKEKLPSYKMNSSPIGMCVIINNASFQDESENRDGSEHDEKSLKDLFEELGFAVKIEKDLTWEQIHKVCKDAADADHSNFDAFVIIIMSHGDQYSVVYSVDNRPVRIEDMMMNFKPMNCATLCNKPKLFFVQSCRGSSSEFLSTGAANRHSDSCVPRPSCDSTLVRSLSPQESDFLLSYAAAPGYFAYRYPDYGTVYIQVLVDVIRAHHKESHLTEMLDEVARKVVERGSTAGDKIPSVQVPTYSTSLRGKVYL